MAFFQVITSFKKVTAKTGSKLPGFVRVALMANTIQLSDYNREQLMSGKDSEGNILPNYSSASVNVFGKPAGPIKLKDKGDFQNSIKPTFGNESFEMKATDDKTEMLQYDYGDDIIGLSKENLDEVSEDIIGQIQYNLRKHFNI